MRALVIVRVLAELLTVSDWLQLPVIVRARQPVRSLRLGRDGVADDDRLDGRAEAWSTWRNLHEAAVLAPRLVNGGTGWACLRLERTILARILFYARGGCVSIRELEEGRGRVVHERLGERGLAGSLTRCRAARAHTL